MNVGIQMKYLRTRRLNVTLILLSLFLGGMAGCAQVSTPAVELSTPTLLPTPSPAAPTEATLPSGWETRTGAAGQGQCGYTISYPADMQGTSHYSPRSEAEREDMYSWILSTPLTEPSGPVPNFVYVSVIPDGFQSEEPGIIYNYDPVEAEILLNMQVGESKSVRDIPNVAQGFTYTRLPDTTLGGQSAQTYENLQPWEFPAGIKEIRYYLQGNGCTYLIGGYLDTTGSDQPGAINQELFDQILATFRLMP